MKKIIPVISIILAVIIAALSVTALIAVCAAMKVDFARLAAVPTVILCFVFSAVNAVFAFLFKKDILCRIAFFIDIGAFALSTVSLCLWLFAI